MRRPLYAALVVAVLSGSSALARDPQRVAPDDAPSSGDVAGPDEPGERLVFEQDPLVTDEIRRRASEPGSVYSLRRIEPGPGGVGQVTQDVVLAR